MSKTSADNLSAGKRVRKNVAFIRGLVGDLVIPITPSVSGQNTPGPALEGPLIYETITAGHPRLFDSEVFLFESLTRKIRAHFKNNPGEAKGVLELVSENAICESCQGIISMFKGEFPNIKIEIRARGSKP